MLKHIFKKVRFEVSVDDKGVKTYDIFQKNNENIWKNVLTTTRLHRAIHRKHNAWLSVMNQSGKTGYLLEKRKKSSARKKLRLKK